MAKQKAGYVYILTNPSLVASSFRLRGKKLIKIGKSRRGAEIRADELYTTGVPARFKVYAKLKVSNPDAVEAMLHKRFARYRDNNKREFFAVEPSMANRALYEAAGRKAQSRRWAAGVAWLMILISAIALMAW